MNTRIGLLGTLLATQVLIVAALLISSGLEADEEANALLPFDATRATSLSITAPDEGVELSLDDDGWRLASGLSATDSKVNEVLRKLSVAKAAWPVATSAASAERFEVATDNFQRRLVIEGEGGETATLYLGSSPGYRRVHARADGSDEVYSIDFANYEVPTNFEIWLDKSLLEPRGSADRITREGGWTLVYVPAEDAGEDPIEDAAGFDPAQDGDGDQQDDVASETAGDPTEDAAGFDPAQDGDGDQQDGVASETAGDPTEDVALAADGDTASSTYEPYYLVDGMRADLWKAAELMGRFNRLSVLGIAETTGEPKGAFTVQDQEGEYRLELFFDEEQDEYSVVSSRVDGRFTMLGYAAERMLVNAEDLMPEEEEPEPVADTDDEPIDETGDATGAL